jgi:hypothetical protein
MASGGWRQADGEAGLLRGGLAAAGSDGALERLLSPRKAASVTLARSLMSSKQVEVDDTPRFPGDAEIGGHVTSDLAAKGDAEPMSGVNRQAPADRVYRYGRPDRLGPPGITLGGP